ncbi:hypothetical protein BB560_001122 [Smittium megazygosporum]|uniref:Uncharacterized protein n=1 Tax=Smittium megazygosporum TaxID=133381 RepID=A0A2T9ZID7_9FUNG|nr:hypothetical protein BB560_001122 [Smittium megazygosporum]
MHLFSCGINIFNQTFPKSADNSELEFSIQSLKAISSKHVLFLNETSSIVINSCGEIETWGLQFDLEDTQITHRSRITKKAFTEDTKKISGSKQLLYLLTDSGYIGRILSINRDYIEYSLVEFDPSFNILNDHSRESRTSNTKKAEYQNIFVNDCAVNEFYLAVITNAGDFVLWDLKSFSSSSLVEPVFCIKADLRSNKIFSEVCCGKYHFLSRCKNGSVYSWSSLNIYSQCGHGNMEVYEFPKQIQALSGINITNISCGYLHSAFVSSDGDLYTCGYNKYYQLGRGYSEHKKDGQFADLSINTADIDDFSIPEPVTEFVANNKIAGLCPFVLSVHCGAGHTIFLLDFMAKTPG